VRSLAVLAALVAGCSFSAPGASGIDAPAGDGAGAGDAPIDGASCPAGLVAVSGAPSRYQAIATPAPFAVAVSTCAGLGAGVHLVRLDSQAEANAIFQLIDDAILITHVPIYRVVGARHANGAGTTDDTWHDLDDVTPLDFLPWGEGEPTSLAGESCMSLREEIGLPPDKVTGADNCTTARPFACECE
jgi:hypothetical protein